MGYCPSSATHASLSSSTALLTFSPKFRALVLMRAESCPTLCDPVDCSPPGSSVHGILQARILEWVATFSSRDLPNPGIEATSLRSVCIGRQVLYTAPSGNPEFHTVQ